MPRIDLKNLQLLGETFRQSAERLAGHRWIAVLERYDALAGTGMLESELWAHALERCALEPGTPLSATMDLAAPAALGSRCVHGVPVGAVCGDCLRARCPFCGAVTPSETDR